MRTPRWNLGEHIVLSNRKEMKRHYPDKDILSFIVVSIDWTPEKNCYEYRLFGDGFMTFTIDDFWLEDYSNNKKAKELLQEEY